LVSNSISWSFYVVIRFYLRMYMANRTSPFITKYTTKTSVAKYGAVIVGS